MPELPDITAYIGAMELRIVGQSLRQVRLGSPFLLRTVQPPLSSVEGRTVEGLRRIGKRIAIGMAGDLNKYTQYQVANAVPLAAQNEGGIAGVGAGISAGVVLGQTMAQSLAGAQRGPAAAGEAPAAAPVSDPEARLGQLKGLLDKGLISAADFESAKTEVLKKLVG